MTMTAPPSTLNPLNFPTGTSASYLIGFEYLSIFPTPTVSGAPFWPEAATDWFSSNSNYSQWTFNVRPGLKWSNGQAVNASDILATYSNNFAFNPSFDFPGLASEVTSDHALNSSAAVFNLNVSDAHFPEKMSWLYFTPVYPASVINANGPNMTNLGTNIVDGPFYMSNYQAGQFQAVMLRNPYFQPQPTVCQIDLNFVDSLAETATPLESGSSDVAPVEPTNALAVLRSSPNMHLSFINASGVMSLEYNVTVYPYSVPAFRQAMAYAINEQQIVTQALSGFGQVANNSEGIVPPEATGYYNPNTVHYSYNQTQSLALLSSIGITKGSNGLLHYSNGTDVTLSLYADTDNPADVLAGNIVKTDLESLGMTINYQTTSEANIIGYYASNVNDLARTGMILYSPGVTVFGDAWLDAEPGWDTYFAPTIPNIDWEYPASINSLYQGNLSALDSTANPSQLKTYLDNIQALNAQYLPTIVLAYPDAIWAYSTAHWTNWPSNGIQFENQFINQTAFSYLQPVSGTTTSTTSTTNAGMSTTDIAIIAVVVIIIVAGTALALLRRRRPPSAQP
jgi:ABC-type transport system substrate-binding protein